MSGFAGAEHGRRRARQELSGDIPPPPPPPPPPDPPGDWPEDWPDPDECFDCKILEEITIYSSGRSSLDSYEDNYGEDSWGLGLGPSHVLGAGGIGSVGKRPKKATLPKNNSGGKGRAAAPYRPDPWIIMEPPIVRVNKALGPIAKKLETWFADANKNLNRNRVNYPFLQNISLAPTPGSGFKGALYGYTRSYGNGVAKFHGGLDLAAKIGTNVYATNNKIVVKRVQNGLGPSQYVEGSLGNFVVLLVSDPVKGDYTLVLGHLATINVKVGDVLNIGDIIGTTGRSGNLGNTDENGNIIMEEVVVESGKFQEKNKGLVPHLHIEVYDSKDGKRLIRENQRNPLDYFPYRFDMKTGKNLNDNEFGNRDIPPFPKAEFPFKGVGHVGSQYISWDTPKMRALWKRELNRLYQETFRKMPPDVWRELSRQLGMYRPNFLFKSEIFVNPEDFRP